MDRILRSNGYFVYSAPPAYRKDKDFPMIWDKLMSLTTAMCWKLIARQVQTAIWVKPDDNSCLQQNAQKNLITICDPTDDAKPSFQSPLRNCISERRSQKLPPKPQRLSEYSTALDKLGSLIWVQIFTIIGLTTIYYSAVLIDQSRLFMGHFIEFYSFYCIN